MDKVMLADALDLEQMQAFREAGIAVVDRRGIGPEELLEELPGFSGLLVRSRTQVTREVLEAAPALRLVGRAGSGTDNIDKEAATAAGVLVMNTPGSNTVAAAEHTVALLLALARHIPQAHADLRGGAWRRSAFVGVQVEKKILGILGLGAVGRAVARRCQGLGMRVVAYDPLFPADAAEALNIRSLPLEEVVGEAHFLTLHVPLTEATRGLLGERLLSLSRPGVRVLNVARGGILDEAALLKALESGQVAGAALDVFEQEPPENKALLAHPRVIVTPHLGASTLEAQKGVARKIAEQAAAYLSAGVVQNAVNMVGWDASLREELEPWLDLAERMGEAAERLFGERIKGAEITFFGRVAALPREPIKGAVLMGLLKPFVGRRLTLVNAPYLARERELSVAERVRERHKSFQSVLKVSLQGEAASFALWGTLFGRKNLRIVRAFGFNIDAIPEGEMLFVANDDCPGIIGHLGGALAAAGINIANMSVGRDREQGRALAVLNLDQPPDEEVLAALGRQPHVHFVRHLSLELP